MRLKGLFLAWGLGLASVGYAGADDALEYSHADDYGNVIYLEKGEDGKNEFIIVDGGETVGMFASASMPIIYDTGLASYVFMPAKSFEEMSDNSQYAELYIVDCDRATVTDESGATMRLINMSAFHRTTAATTCAVLESTQ